MYRNGIKSLMTGCKNSALLKKSSSVKMSGMIENQKRLLTYNERFVGTSQERLISPCMAAIMCSICVSVHCHPYHVEYINV